MLSVNEKLTWIFFCGLIKNSVAVYNYDYLADNCTASGWTRDLSMSPSTYGFVRPVREGGYPKGMNCSLTVKAPPNHYLIVKFRRLEIYSLNPCSDGDYLMVSGNSSKFTYCGYRTPSHSLISTTNMINIRFVSTVNINDNTRMGFEIYYTAFHRGPCRSGGDFPEEFLCRIGGRCIPSELRCDRLDNCGDWSDERAGACGMSRAMTVCMSIVFVLVGGTCTIALFMCVCAKKRERSARSARERNAVQVEYSRNGSQSVSVNPQTGEKPPLPEYDNRAFTVVPPSSYNPELFVAPPAYETISGPPSAHSERCSTNQMLPLPQPVGSQRDDQGGQTDGNEYKEVDLGNDAR